MAKPLSNVAAVQVGCLLVLLVLSLPTLAETLPDPTRPPSATVTTEDGREASLDSTPTVQSILVSPQRTIAVVNGQTVKLGDAVGEAKVVKITESEVVLRQGKDLQVLKLFPSIEKQRTSSRASTKADAK